MKTDHEHATRTAREWSGDSPTGGRIENLANCYLDLRELLLEACNTLDGSYPIKGPSRLHDWWRANGPLRQRRNGE